MPGNKRHRGSGPFVGRPGTHMAALPHVVPNGIVGGVVPPTPTAERTSLRLETNIVPNNGALAPTKGPLPDLPLLIGVAQLCAQLIPTTD